MRLSRRSKPSQSVRLPSVRDDDAVGSADHERESEHLLKDPADLVVILGPRYQPDQFVGRYG